MGNGLKTVINELQGNVASISAYLANPEKYLSNYNLSEAEKHALINKDIDSLITLGVDSELVAGAMSAPWAHSQRCTIK
ncbi:hypothetical protein JDW15_08065 [Aerococcaceae bacterium zg-ZJ1578]|uniref:hypothetical protein n=1 Tax=Aerococcaceae bacterium zg-252 TaxID=2796928 RepID=UPI001A19F136|nr:hypothetical protein [Aerococcaceae bacterium zg-1578]